MTLGPRPSIPRTEYAERRDRARRSAAASDLDGLIAWSMGGSTLDRYSNVFWLTNHYEIGNVFPDVLPIFTGFGQAALVLPARGESILVVNQPDWRDDLVENRTASGSGATCTRASSKPSGRLVSGAAGSGWPTRSGCLRPRCGPSRRRSPTRACCGPTSCCSTFGS